MCSSDLAAHRDTGSGGGTVWTIFWGIGRAAAMRTAAFGTAADFIYVVAELPAGEQDGEFI